MKITIYVSAGCPYCDLSLGIIARKFPDAILETLDRTHVSVPFISSALNHFTFPMVFIDKDFIGGYTELTSFVDSLRPKTTTTPSWQQRS